MFAIPRFNDTSEMKERNEDLWNVYENSKHSGYLKKVTAKYGVIDKNSIIQLIWLIMCFEFCSYKLSIHTYSDKKSSPMAIYRFTDVRKQTQKNDGPSFTVRN